MDIDKLIPRALLSSLPFCFSSLMDIDKLIRAGGVPRVCGVLVL